MVTSRDVARHAGVSQATVSRVLNDNPKVDPDIRARVLASLKEIGYVPNAVAKAMRTNRSGAIGIATAEIQNPFLPFMLEELTKAAAARNLNVTVWNESDPGVPMATAGIAGGSVDGVLFMATRTDTFGVHDLIERGYPIMLVNRAGDEEKADVVMSDHYASGYAAGQYFAAGGRRSIAAIFGPDNTYASPARERGFRAALEDAGIQLRAEHVFSGVTSYDTGVAAVERMRSSLGTLDAVFCSSDIIAYGALDALRGEGLRIPDDLWVIGIDGLSMSGWRSFDLTTQRQQVETIAEKAIDGLLRRIGGEAAEPERTIIPTEWIFRGSSPSIDDGTAADRGNAL